MLKATPWRKYTILGEEFSISPLWEGKEQTLELPDILHTSSYLIPQQSYK